MNVAAIWMSALRKGPFHFRLLRLSDAFLFSLLVVVSCTLILTITVPVIIIAIGKYWVFNYTKKSMCCCWNELDNRIQGFYRKCPRNTLIVNVLFECVEEMNMDLRFTHFFRISHPDVLLGKIVLKVCRKVTGGHPSTWVF